MRQEQIQDPQIHQLNNGNQEWGTTRRKREGYDKWRNADEPRNKNYYTPLQSTARREDCKGKDKDPAKSDGVISQLIWKEGKRTGDF